MPDAPFTIGSDPARRLLTIGVASLLWDMALARHFAAGCAAAVARLDCAPGQHLVLVDLRNAVIQSQDVFERLHALVSASVARRIALVAAAPLARMQTKRLQLRDNVVMFGDLREAEAWLFEAAARAA
jgi:hypothetical protein